MSGRISPRGLLPTYYRVTTVNDGLRIRIDNVRIPRGASIHIARGWDRFLGMREGLQIEELNTSGNIFLADGRFSPEPIDGAANQRGQMIGLAISYDAQGREVGEPIAVPLKGFPVQERLDHVQAAIEIVDFGKPGKMTLVERRLDTKGLSEDRSKYVYTLTQAGTRLLEQQVIDFQWVTDVRVHANGATVSYTTPDAPRTIKTLEMPAICFRDNEGKPLLGNRAAEVNRPDHVYQAVFYTPETERFRPTIDEMHGQLRLIVHKVDRREIPRPAGLEIPAGGSVKVHPTAADTAALVNGRWVPLTLKEPLTCQPIAPFIKTVGVEEMLDKNLSQVEAGEVQSAIGPQTRFGEPNNISSEYVRDPYFYGLTIEAMFKMVERYGENFAINRAKAVRANRGIQSGRTHVMPFRLLFNAFADILPTNNPHLKKLSNFAEEIWGPGVSEDTQMEMAYWLKGIKMWVVKEMVALMTAEKEWGKYDTQNTKRYDYSEVLFNLSFLLSRMETFEARFFGKLPVLMQWQEASEIAAGRTWYKMPHAKITELLAIPSYLFSLGHVLFYPVDLVYFIGAWLGRTVASSINYTRHLTQLGYNFITGFWKNPAMELTMMAGYARAAWKQWLERNQYGTFMLTVGAAGELIPKNNRRLVWGFAAATGSSLALTAGVLTLGGLFSWLLLPVGLALLPVGLSTLAKGLNHHRGWRRFARAAGGAAAAAAGLGLTVLGAPVVAANFLSIAVIANIGFGLYSLGLLIRSILDIKQAQREDELQKKENSHQEPLTEAQQQRLSSVADRLYGAARDLPYAQLHKVREELRTLLRELGAMDKKGRIIQGIEHPARFAAFNILDLHADIEAAICKRACRELVGGHNQREARAALLNILRTSREYIIIDFAAKTYRRFGLKLEGEV